MFTETLLGCMALGEGNVGLSWRKLISEHHAPQTERGGQESLDIGALPVTLGSHSRESKSWFAWAQAHLRFDFS